MKKLLFLVMLVGCSINIFSDEGCCIPKSHKESGRWACRSIYGAKGMIGKFDCTDKEKWHHHPCSHYYWKCEI